MIGWFFYRDYRIVVPAVLFILVVFQRSDLSMPPMHSLVNTCDPSDLIGAYLSFQCSDWSKPEKL
jgi:hypothetical protein